MCLNIKICNILGPNLTDMRNFHRLEVVSRCRDPQPQVGENSNKIRVNLYNAEIYLYKTWRTKGFSQFETTINVLVRSFRSI